MSLADTIADMHFVEICTNDYEEEPHIEFEFGDTGDGELYAYEDFIAIIKNCKRLGVNCEHLEACLPEFQKEMQIFASMHPEDNIPASM